MVNKPKPQTLRERIEKSQELDTIDSDLQSHYDEVMRSIGSIGPIEPFSLLDSESAKAAVQQFSAKIDKLSQIGKQIKAVNFLLKEKQGASLHSISNLPWPDPDKNSDKEK
jgi:hypothetical protein